MEAIEILDIVSNNETSRVQFKETIDSTDSLMAEMAAFSNCKGGLLLIGVKDRTGEIVGVTSDQIQDISSKAANIASQNIIPQIYIITEVVVVDEKKVLVLEVKEGSHKPYYDKNGIIWTKNAADKRRVTDQNEIARLMAEGGNLSADEMPIKDANVSDLNLRDLYAYCTILDSGFSGEGVGEIEQLLENLHLYRDGFLNLAALLLFGQQPQRFRPAFCVKSVSFFGNDIEGDRYRSSKDITGNLSHLYEQSKQFILSNLDSLQNGRSVNSQGQLEIPEIVVEEMLVNALMHRDYFKNAPIRVLIFDNRVEIVSPGKLPNNLTVDNIKSGNAVVRNNIITSMGSRLLPYRGLGSGVRRAIKECPSITFDNDIDGEQFKVVIPRANID